MRRAILGAIVGSVLACGDDIPDGGTGGGTGGSTGSPGTTAVDPTTGAVDDTSTGAPPGEIVLDASLDLEALASIHVVLSEGAAVQATINASRGYGLVPDDVDLVGPARIDAFPEAGATFYTARFSVPAQPDGPCGDAPVSLALSLHHDADASFLAGGLTGYCGSDTWYGVPAIEPLRISGRLR